MQIPNVADAIIEYGAAVALWLKFRESLEQKNASIRPCVIVLPGPRGFRATPLPDQFSEERIVPDQRNAASCEGCRRCGAWARIELRSIEPADIERLGRVIALLAFRKARPDLCAAELIDGGRSSLALTSAEEIEVDAQIALLLRSADETGCIDLAEFWRWNARMLEVARDAVTANELADSR